MFRAQPARYRDVTANEEIPMKSAAIKLISLLLAATLLFGSVVSVDAAGKKAKPAPTSGWTTLTLGDGGWD